jgi:hypothetical protein
MHKELRKLQKELEAQGFETRVSSKGHLLVSMNGKRVAVFAGTPSDIRSLRNGLADVKRAGFRWPPRRR